MKDRLLHTLRNRASAQGVVITREVVLCDELQSTSEALRVALTALATDSEIEILSPLPYLVLRLKRWPGNHEESSNLPTSAYSYPKLLQSKRLKKSYRPERPRGGDELLHEILETLGETDGASFKKAVELYSPYVIRTALSRVRRAQGIRKSRTALFRHLLPRLARKSQSPS